jgi:RNA polymerase sigma-70 factor, ECF subfamily
MPLDLDALPEHAPACRTRPLDVARAGDHLDRLYRTARAITGSPHEADDLVQDTYARVLSRPRRLRSETDHGYLLAALRHAFIDGRRRRRNETVPLDDLPGEIADTTTRRRPEEAIAATEVYAAIAALPNPHREVVAAVDVAGLSYGETAEVLGVPIGTVMSRLYRARARLGAQFAGAPA